MGFIFDRLIEKSPKIAEELLNHHLDSNHDQEPSQDVVMTLDFGLFKKEVLDLGSCQPLSQNESLSPFLMLQNGHTDLVKNPVTESFVNLKWQLLKWNYTVGVTFATLYAIAVSLAVVWGKQHTVLVWLMLAMYTLMSLRNFVRMLRLKSGFFIDGWKQVQCRSFKNPTNYVMVKLPRIKWPDVVVEFGLLVSTILFLLSYLNKVVSLAVYFHFSAWMVLLAWLKLYLELEESPVLGIYIHMVNTVMKDVLMFGFSVLSLVIGFGMAFYMVHRLNRTSDLFTSPLASIFYAMTLIGGQFDDELYSRRDKFRLRGTEELLFVFSFWALTLCFCNVLIGVSIVNVKSILAQKQDYKLTKMIIINYNVEDTYHFILNIICCTRKGCCFYVKKFFKKWVSLLETHHMFGLKPLAVNSPAPRVIGDEVTHCQVPIFKSSLECQGPLTGYKVPGWIWENSRGLIEDKHEDLKARNAERKRLGDNDDYTSLYWDSSDTPENEYEEVEANGESKGGIKGLRESLLREIRKDFGRLLRTDRVYNKDPGKCVNVRPGLALGVITLQAGARGHNIAIH